MASSGYQALYFGFASLYHAGHVWRRHFAEDIAKAGQRGIVSLAFQAKAIRRKMLQADHSVQRSQQVDPE